MSTSAGSTTSRKVVANIEISLDGCVADDPSDGAGGMRWLLEHAVHDQVRTHFEGIYRAADTALMGWTNFEGFRGYWPSVTQDPAVDPRDRDFARWLDEVEKVAFSRSLKEAEWQNARVAHDLPAEVRALKAVPGRDILVLSSSSIIRGLIEHGLLDELHVSVLPAVLGSGRRLFPDGTTPSTWQLDGTTVFATGGVALHYRRS